jgi:hypothetical protein
MAQTASCCKLRPPSAQRQSLAAALMVVRNAQLPHSRTMRSSTTPAKATGVMRAEMVAWHAGPISCSYTHRQPPDDTHRAQLCVDESLVSLDE